MSELTGQQIWKLLAESFEDKSDDESISIGAWSKVPKSELTPWNMPEFSGRMSLTMAEVRKYATEQPADPPADHARVAEVSVLRKALAEIDRVTYEAKSEAAHDARLTAPLGRRVGELLGLLSEAYRLLNHSGMLTKHHRERLEAALASTSREGTEEPVHYVSGAIELGIYDQLAEQPADPPADREQDDDDPLDTPEYTAALEADHAKWLAGRVARREQVRREVLEEMERLLLEHDHKTPWSGCREAVLLKIRSKLSALKGSPNASQL